MLYKSHLLTLETIGYSWIHIYCDQYWFMDPRGRFTHGLLYWIVGTGYIQVRYRLCTKGRAPRTKETLPDFRERCWVTLHSQAFPRVEG